MAHKEINIHPSSMQVMFSDRTSTYFGISLIFFMVILSCAFFVVKFQKHPIRALTEIKIRKNIASPLLFKKNRYRSNFFLMHPIKSKPFSPFLKPSTLQKTAFKQATLAQ